MNTLRIFNHYVHRRLFLLAAVQYVILIGAVYLGAGLRFFEFADTSSWQVQLFLPKALFFALVVTVCMAAMGVYRPQHGGVHRGVLFRVAAALVCAAVALSVSFYLVPELFLGRGVLGIALALAFVAVSAVQVCFNRLLDPSLIPTRVLLYGAGANAASVLAEFDRYSDSSLINVVACIALPGETTRVDPTLVRPVPASLAQFARDHRIAEIVLACDDRRQNFPSDQLISCRMAGIQVSETLSFCEVQWGKIKTALLQPGWIILSHGFRSGVLNNGAKRLVDIAVAALLLVFTLPLLLLAWAAIVIEDGLGAPVLFWQQRVGANGRVYSICKLRSMRVQTDAAYAGPQWTQVNDDRVTRVGRLLRKYRVDELPQLFNVLRGDMSMVGPRPERPEIVADLSRALPYYHVRECVRPGLTGWAQLRYSYGASQEDADAKLEFDLYYVKNRSLFLDFVIMLGTLEVIIFSKGAR